MRPRPNSIAAQRASGGKNPADVQSPPTTALRLLVVTARRNLFAASVTGHDGPPRSISRLDDRRKRSGIE